MHQKPNEVSFDTRCEYGMGFDADCTITTPEVSNLRALSVPNSEIMRGFAPRP